MAHCYLSAAQTPTSLHYSGRNSSFGHGDNLSSTLYVGMYHHVNLHRDVNGQTNDGGSQ
jgi:hypothetical protein